MTASSRAALVAFFFAAVAVASSLAAPATPPAPAGPAANQPASATAQNGASLLLNASPELRVGLNNAGRIVNLSSQGSAYAVKGDGGWDIADLARGRDETVECPLPEALPEAPPSLMSLLAAADATTPAPAWRIGLGWKLEPANATGAAALAAPPSERMAVTSALKANTTYLELVVPAAAAVAAHAACTLTVRLRGNAPDTAYRLGVVPINALGVATAGWVDFDPAPPLSPTTFSQRSCTLFPPPDTAGLLLVCARDSAEPQLDAAAAAAAAQSPIAPPTAKPAAQTDSPGSLTIGGARAIWRYPGPTTAVSTQLAGDANVGAANFTGANDNVTLNTHYACRDGALHVSADLSANEDRALSVTFHLPVDAAGWEWWDNLRQHETIGAGNPRSYHVWRHLGGGHLYSPWPLAALTSVTPAAGLALAGSLAADVPWRFSYRQGQGLSATCDVGLSPKTGHGSVKLELVVYPTDPQWGLRGALERYYRLFPADVAAHETEAGAWFTGFYPDAIANPQRLGLLFDEQAAAHTDWTAAHRLRPMAFRQPWVKPAADGQPAPADALAPAIPSRDPSGRLVYPIADLGLTDANVDLQPITNRMPVSDGDAADPNVKVVAPKLTEWGLALDGIGDAWAGWDQNVVDRALWSTVQAPLSVDRAARTPTLLGATLRTEQLHALHNRVHPKSTLLGGPSTLQEWPYSLPWLDVLAGGDHCPAEEHLVWLRALGPGKPLTFLEADLLDPALDSDGESRLWYSSLLTGSFPGIVGCFTRRSATTNLNVFDRYVPQLRTLVAAGWQVVPFATTEDADVHVERFGRGDQLSLVIHNNAAHTRSFKLTLDPTQLALPKTPKGGPSALFNVLAQRANDLVPDVVDGRWQLDLSLPADGLAILRPTASATPSVDAATSAKPTPKSLQIAP